MTYSSFVHQGLCFVPAPGTSCFQSVQSKIAMIGVAQSTQPSLRFTKSCALT